MVILYTGFVKLIRRLADGTEAQPTMAGGRHRRRRGSMGIPAGGDLLPRRADCHALRSAGDIPALPQMARPLLAGGDAYIRLIPASSMEAANAILNIFACFLFFAYVVFFETDNSFAGIFESAWRKCRHAP